MKLYVSFEGDPPFTKVVRRDQGDAVESIFSEFAAAYNARFGAPARPLDATRLTALGPDRRPLQPASALGRSLPDGADVEVAEVAVSPSPGPMPPAATQPPCSAAADASPKQEQREQQVAVAAASTPTRSPAPSAPAPGGPGRAQAADPAAPQRRLLLKALGDRAEEAAALKGYRTAGELLQQVCAMEHAPPPPRAGA